VIIISVKRSNSEAPPGTVTLSAFAVLNDVANLNSTGGEQKLVMEYGRTP
jgi:hypothetical protein